MIDPREKVPTHCNEISCFVNPSANTKTPRFLGALLLERVEGVEPSSLPWQGSIIAAIRYPLGHRIISGDPYVIKARFIVQGQRVS